MKLITPNTASPLGQLDRLLKSKKYEDARFFILTDENCFEKCLTHLIANVEVLQEAEFMELPIGEQCKDIEIATQIWQTLVESEADRDTVLINLGGGTVSDLGGFVAAGYKRGIRFVNVPTTLIGMVDAAIGSKTGINLGGSKNQVGFFHNAEAVCIDTAFLETLPQEELKNGIFEMLKTFMVSDSKSYYDLCNAIIERKIEVDERLVTACAEIKLAIVRHDPKDHGTRRILNLGHTFGHAIEAYSHQVESNQTPLGHGMSVGVGMICALYLSVKKLGLDEEYLNRYRKVVESMMTIPRYTLRDTEGILQHMRRDKKNSRGEIRCVLLKDIGAPVIDLVVDENKVRDALLKI